MDLKNTIFIIDHCTEGKTEFFTRILPGCVVEEDYMVKYNGKEYDIMPKVTVGIDVQRDLKMYVLEEWIEPKKTPVIRVVDFDGMGGKEYLYHCGNCKVETGRGKFCSSCGSEFGEVEIQDTWGIK